MRTHLHQYLVGVFLFAITCGSVLAAEVRVAVASNFAYTLQAIATRFEASTEHSVTLIVGSTGKHYAQIKHGAPFNAFFAADDKRPQYLEQEGLAVPGSRFTYAIGKVALWSPTKNTVEASLSVLEQHTFRHLAIANPKLAPYGKAAQEVLEHKNLWRSLQSRLVRGENISQTFQFVKSGNADLGFVALAQLVQSQQPIEGSYWLAPQSLYTPIKQQAVLLSNPHAMHANPDAAKENQAASRAFLAYVKNDESSALIRRSGYDTP